VEDELRGQDNDGEPRGFGAVERHEHKDEIERGGSRCNPKTARFTGEEANESFSLNWLTHEGHTFAWELDYLRAPSQVPIPCSFERMIFPAEFFGYLVVFYMFGIGQSLFICNLCRL
jgi:hypothetical protein